MSGNTLCDRRKAWLSGRLKGFSAGFSPGGFRLLSRGLHATDSAEYDLLSFGEGVFLWSYRGPALADVTFGLGDVPYYYTSLVKPPLLIVV